MLEVHQTTHFLYELLQNHSFYRFFCNEFRKFSSSDDSSSSSEHLNAFSVNGELVEGIQGYQFQPRRDSYTSSEEDASSEGADSSTGTNDSFNVRLGNLNW